MLILQTYLFIFAVIGLHVPWYSHNQKPLEQLPRTPKIDRWAALGDSYAAGLGAGKRLSSWSAYDCSRYNGSYPYLLHTHPVFNTSSHFNYLACSGATSGEILENQVSKLNKTAKYDLITLSAGGNDVHLADVLNACIFQWNGGNDEDCEKQLNVTEKAITKELGPNVDKLLHKLKTYLSEDAKIYQTGYGTFFDDSSQDCNNVTWAFWYSGLGWWEKQYLTQSRRKRMNDLTIATNRIIEQAVEKAGKQVEFVSFDAQFIAAKGLFCEPGVHEPSPEREALLFFEWDTADKPGDNDTLTISAEAVAGTFERKVLDWVKEGRDMNPTAISVAQHEAKSNGVHESSSTDAVTEGVVPDGYMRVFHPRPAGHLIMAERLLKKMGAWDQKGREEL